MSNTLEFLELDWKVPGYLGHTRDNIGLGIVLLLHIDINIMISSCSHLGHSGDTVVAYNIQLKTKSGNI